MVTKSGIIGLVAGLAVVLFAVSMAGEESTKYIKIIETVDESGFSQQCVELGCYTPVIAHVKSGSVVTMTNTDPTGVHTFTSGTVNGFTPSPDGTFDSSVLMSGDTFEHKFSSTGTYDYYCMLHTWMTGKIIVK
jgi:plastocyanin